MTQEDAANRLDIDRTTLGRIEVGKVPYNQDFLERAAFAYGCEPDELLRVDPSEWSRPRLIFNELERLPRDRQEVLLDVLERLLKAG